MKHFVENLSRVNTISKYWSRAFNLKFHSILREVESNIEVFIIERLARSFSMNVKYTLGDFLKKKQEFLALEESKRCLKRKPI
jgi:hypothetical protein